MSQFMTSTIFRIVCGVVLLLAGYTCGRVDGKRAAFEPRVERTGDATLMKVGPVGVQTVSKLDGGSTGLYYDWAALVGVFAPDARKVAMLGLGGGEMLRVLKRTVPSAQLWAVEIDDRVIMAALRDFPQNTADVKILSADAARYVHSGCAATGPVDALIVDVFEGSEIPFHFTTVAFFKEVERCLSPRGMVVMNAKDRFWARYVAAAMHDAGFENVVAFPVTGAPNVMLWAVRKDDWGEVRSPPELQESFIRRWEL